MKSRTKYEIKKATIVKLFEKAGITGAESIAPLGAGEYNSVYSVDAGGKPYAIKIAPLNNAKVLTYEQQMMEQEVYYYGLMNKAGIHVPEIYYADFSKEDIPTEYFIMERLSGKHTYEPELPRRQQPIFKEKLAGMVAQMHSVKGEEFGYRQNGLHVTWHQALVSMVTNLIKDCKKLGHRSLRGYQLLGYINHHQTMLEKVECSLINFDIWPANIINDQKDGEFHLSWIDPERCLWGDRIADFVCLDFMNLDLGKKTAILEAYNNASEEPITVGDDERIRFAIMLGYLALIMEVEKYARYNFFLKGWWRNVVASTAYYNEAFKQLSELTK